MAWGKAAGMRSARTWWALAAVVLLAHLGAIEGLGQAWREATQIKPMIAPVFTRTLMPAAPPPAQAAPAVPVPVTKSAKKPPAAVDSQPVDSQPVEATPTVLATEQLPTLAPTTTPPLATRTLALALTEEALSSFSEVRSPTVALSTASLVVTQGSTVGGSGSYTVASWPSDTRLSYRVSGYYQGDITGDATVLWLRQGEKYQVVLTVRIGPKILPLVTVKMTSEGKVRATSLWPEQYEELMPRKRSLALGDEFITLGDGSSVLRPAGVQDTVSQFVELTQRFVSGRGELKDGGTVMVPLARPGGLNEWTYDVIDTPKLQTQVGNNYAELAAWHLKPRPVVNARGPITMDFWLVPQLQYFPAKVKITLGPQAFVEMDIDKIEQR